MTLLVRHPGLQTTVQDLGRPAWQHIGVPVGGAMDPQAHRLANLLVGNPVDAAALDCAFGGLAVQFRAPALVALTGREVTASLDGVAVPAWRTLRAHAGALLVLHTGCRTTVAVAGGIDVPVVLDGRGTALRGAFGGGTGRALQKDDLLALGAPSALAHEMTARLERRSRLVGDWTLSPALVPRYAAQPTVRFVEGPEFGRLTDASRAALLHDSFRIAPESDRMGFRLAGPPLALTTSRDMLSSGVTAGTLQLPPGGAPIVLMADRQTTGGYPRLGDVITVDLPLVAQLRPGEALRFMLVPLAHAHDVYRIRERALGQAQRALQLRGATGADDAR